MSKKADLKRDQIKKEFKETLDNLIVLDRKLRDEIFYQYCQTESRLKLEKLQQKKNWQVRKPDLLLTEYNCLIKQIDYLQIFSDKFRSLLWLQWNRLVGTFRPDEQ